MAQVGATTAPRAPSRPAAAAARCGAPRPARRPNRPWPSRPAARHPAGAGAHLGGIAGRPLLPGGRPAQRVGEPRQLMGMTGAAAGGKLSSSFVVRCIKPESYSHQNDNSVFASHELLYWHLNSTQTGNYVSFPHHPHALRRHLSRTADTLICRKLGTSRIWANIQNPGVVCADFFQIMVRCNSRRFHL